LTIVVVVTCAAGLRSQQPAEIPVAITGVTVIDTTSGRLTPAMSVLIAGGRIAEVGPTSLVRIPERARRVDVAGKFLIRGSGTCTSTAGSTLRRSS
jgi:imidazolonepropionase-like amidohydrolase